MIELLGPAIVAAAVSGVISLCGVWVTRSTTIRVNRERFDFDRRLAEQKRSDELQLAERRFQYDRDLHDHKRRVELAEEILTAFYNFAEVLREVRSPGGFKYESEGRSRYENERPEDESKLNAYYVPIARITQQSEYFSGLLSKRYRGRALLGQSIDKAFAELSAAVWEVQTKAMMLMGMVGRGGAAFELQPDIVEKYEATIWQSNVGDDPIEAMVKRAIELAEAVCRPILEREQ
jgi:hypothetical protein